MHVINLNPNQTYINQLDEVVNLPTIMSSPVEFMDHNDNIHQDPDRKVIYTDQSSKVINVVKKGYTFENNQPSDIVRLSEATLLQSGVSLKGLKRTVQMAPDGSKMIITYTLPEFLIDLGNGDITQFQIIHPYGIVRSFQLIGRRVISPGLIGFKNNAFFIQNGDVGGKRI